MLATARVKCLEFEVKGNNPMGFRWDGSYSYSDDP